MPEMMGCCFYIRLDALPSLILEINSIDFVQSQSRLVHIIYSGYDYIRVRVCVSVVIDFICQMRLDR